MYICSKLMIRWYIDDLCVSSSCKLIKSQLFSKLTYIKIYKSPIWYILKRACRYFQNDQVDADVDLEAHVTASDKWDYLGRRKPEVGKNLLLLMRYHLFIVYI